MHGFIAVFIKISNNEAKLTPLCAFSFCEQMFKGSHTQFLLKTAKPYLNESMIAHARVRLSLWRTTKAGQFGLRLFLLKQWTTDARTDSENGELQCNEPNLSWRIIQQPNNLINLLQNQVSLPELKSEVTKL